MGLMEDWQARGAHHELLGHRVFVVDVAPATERAVPVLILHGFPTSSIDWHAAVDPIVMTGRRVVALDLLGYGFSDKPDQRYSLFEQADIVAALAQELGLDTVALVTHDMGDSVGGEVLARSI